MSLSEAPLMVVLGAAESGVGAAILAQQKGYRVWVSDNGTIAPRYQQLLDHYQIPYEQGQHTAHYLLTAHEVVKSPGIPEKAAIVQQLRHAQIPILSEVAFAARYITVPIIAITGTNGKTTTTALAHHLLQHAGIRAAVAGNIGDSLALHVATTQNPPECYVVEVSSFQLDDNDTFRPHIAVITNITPDHLDRYQYQMERYIAAKCRITQHQTATDYLIYNADDPHTANALQQLSSTLHAQLLPFSPLPHTTAAIHYHAQQGLMYISSPRLPTQHIRRADLALHGQHNTANALCACTIAHLMGLLEQQISAGLASFAALEHRLEPVATIEGVLYINDSKATNTDSTWYALDAMTQPTVWIAGGTDKGNDYSVLLPLVERSVKAIVCMCVDASKIIAAYQHLGIPITQCQSAQTAVAQAHQLAQPSDVVLLSPACASFDLFKNYEDRGRQFKQAVQHLADALIAR